MFLQQVELARRGVGAELMKKHRIKSRGPQEFLMSIINRIDHWDVLCYERAKVQVQHNITYSMFDVCVYAYIYICIHIYINFNSHANFCCFPMKAFMQRSLKRMQKSESLYQRTHRRVLDSVRARENKAISDKELQRKQFILDRKKQQRIQREKYLKDQVALEVTNREVREREVLTQLLKRKREWREQRIIRKGLDQIDQSYK